MSGYLKQRDRKQARALRAWCLPNLKSHLEYCRRQERAPSIHKQARRMFKQSQQAIEEEITHRLGPDWEQDTTRIRQTRSEPGDA